jgi:hypothetical protein
MPSKILETFLAFASEPIQSAVQPHNQPRLRLDLRLKVLSPAQVLQYFIFLSLINYAWNDVYRSSIWTRFFADLKKGEANFTFKSDPFEAAIAIYIPNMFATAVNGKLVEVLWFHPKHALEGIGLHPTKVGAIFIDLTFAGAVVKMNAPATWPNHTEVECQLWRGKIVSQIGAIAWVKLTAGSAVFDAMPCSHNVLVKERASNERAGAS